MDGFNGEEKLKALQISEEVDCNTKRVSVVELVELRGKGNSCFRHRNWKRAINYYSQCIDLALSCQKNAQKVQGSSNVESFNKEEMDALVCCYSNRAEARLKLMEYGQAVEDCDKALDLDPLHLKSLFRKGRSLHALGEYKLACYCFKTATEKCPTASEIKLQYEESKKFNDQNQQGMFDISAYFLNGCRSQDIRDVSNYIGPVMIKKSPGCGRGLFAMKDIDVGDNVLVENAIAVSGIYKRRLQSEMESNSKTTVEHLKEDTVAKVISSAMSSPKIMQQLQYLVDSSFHVPDMDLFRINNGSWKKYDVIKTQENLQLDMDKLRKAMQINLLLTYVVDEEDAFAGHNTNSSSWRVLERCGIWGLSSFINHSCIPNAKWMVVGKAMFIIAARKISAGDEITVTYFDSLIPLATREQKCREMGFRCECKRCMFERTLRPSFEKFAQFYMKQMDNNSWVFDDPERYIVSLVELAVQLEKEIHAQGDLITVEGKQMILASFETMYPLIFSNPIQYPLINVPPFLLSKKVEVAEAIQHVVPGSMDSFQLFASLLEEPHRKDNRLLLQKAMKVGISVFGRHKPDVLKSLLKANPHWHRVSKV